MIFNRFALYYLLTLTIFIHCSSGGFLFKSEKFAKSDYHRLSVQKLEACPVAMESLGCPPLKVHNIHLLDRNNRIDQYTAQVSSYQKTGYI